MIDPWPGIGPEASRQDGRAADDRERAQDRNFHALVYFWVGWS